MDVIDQTVIESGDGRMYAITLNEDDTISVADCTDVDSLRDAKPIGTWTFAALAGVTALSLDFCAGRYLDTIAMANLRQWARI